MKGITKDVISMIVVGFPKFKEAGEVGNKQHYLIVEQLGKSLKDVTREIKKVFSMKTVC